MYVGIRIFFNFDTRNVHQILKNLIQNFVKISKIFESRATLKLFFFNLKIRNSIYEHYLIIVIS